MARSRARLFGDIETKTAAIRKHDLPSALSAPADGKCAHLKGAVMASRVTDARKRDVIGDCPIPRDYDAAPRGRLAAEDCRVGRRLRGPGFVHECEPARSPGGGRRTALSIDAEADVAAGTEFDRLA